MRAWWTWPRTSWRGHKLKVAGLWDRKRFGRGDGGGVGLKVVVTALVVSGRVTTKAMS